MAMTTTERLAEQHPSHPAARVVRSLRGLRRLPGWQRIAGLLVLPTASGAFVVANRSGYFAGDLSSFIDRRMYLFGEYEQELIEAFIAHLPLDRRGTILDVGANVGTHSLAFARHFRTVHAFEPNPALWPSFERNVAINGLQNVRLHRLGLADKDDELSFHLIEKSNYGLGTFSEVEQYDLPLKSVGKVPVAAGDKHLEETGVGPIDAIKIDVQGFEPEVIRGLAGTLTRYRPHVWIELGPGTKTKVDTLTGLQKLVHYPIEAFRFAPARRGLFSTVSLQRTTEDSLEPGDYLVGPA